MSGASQGITGKIDCAFSSSTKLDYLKPLLTLLNFRFAVRFGRSRF